MDAKKLLETTKQKGITALGIEDFVKVLDECKESLIENELYKEQERAFKNTVLNVCFERLEKSKTIEEFEILTKEMTSELLYKYGILGHSKQYFNNKKAFSMMTELFEKPLQEMWENYAFINQKHKKDTTKIDIDNWEPVFIDNNGEIKISIIIPCYNVEQYLSECLDSILNQELKDIEIICVDDGSTDKTCEILKSYADKDSRVVIIQKENGGAASARNEGLKSVKGKYVYYMDSDDFLHEKALSYVYTRMEELKTDMLFFSTEVFFESDEIYRKQKHFAKYYKRTGEYENVLSGQELFIKFVENDDFRPAPWIYVSRADFIKENDLQFRPGIIMEDQLYTTQCISLAKRAAYDDVKLYNRRVRENSVMTGSSVLKKAYSAFTVIKEMAEFSKQRNLSENKEYYKALLTRLWKISSMEHKNLLTIDLKEIYDFIYSLNEDEAIDFYFYMVEPMIKSGHFIENEKLIKEVSENMISLRAKNKFDQNKAKKTITSFERKINNSEKIIEESKEEIISLKKGVEKQQNQIKSLEEQMHKLEQENKSLNNQKNKLLNSWDYKIGKILFYIPKKLFHIFKK